MFRMPIFTWNILVTSLLILFAFPPLTAALAMLFIDRHFGGAFFDPAQGGTPILWQHLFWFFGHPEVYILILPFFGVITEIIPVFSRKPLFGYARVRARDVRDRGLSMSVWAHHMFTTGAVDNPFFSLASFAIAVPTGVKFFNWIATMWRGQPDVRDADAVGDRLPLPVPARRDHRGDRWPRRRSTSSSRTRTSSSPTSTTRWSAARSSRSSPASTTGSRR